MMSVSEYMRSGDTDADGQRVMAAQTPILDERPAVNWVTGISITMESTLKPLTKSTALAALRNEPAVAVSGSNERAPVDGWRSYGSLDRVPGVRWLFQNGSPACIFHGTARLFARGTLRFPEISAMLAASHCRPAFAGACLMVAASVAPAQSTIPARLTNAELWQLNVSFSEPGGYFRSENFLSNETGFQYVIPDLLRIVKPGGVYLGVGPEQNFTYIAALQPKMAIIFDIRRGNMIEHLMYKAVFEMSNDRADFLSRLFSRPRPAGLDTSSTAQALFQAYAVSDPDSVLFRKNLTAIEDHLTKDRGFVLGDSDTKSLEYIYSAFYGGGPFINYNYPNG
ncbi:MAG TPA: hypothetical protein VHV78_09960, partial [Gemmatimonadaceae bacterium]|nr:hypothetical protein [Gemmatimonadaceae bacterium]